jgi:hypothetical protein
MNYEEKSMNGIHHQNWNQQKQQPIFQVMLIKWLLSSENNSVNIQPGESVKITLRIKVIDLHDRMMQKSFLLNILRYNTDDDHLKLFTIETQIETRR